MRILAVDDDSVVLDLLEVIFKQSDGIEVVVAASGALALEAIATSKDGFDCFLLDISMPEMTGIELCERIRVLGAHRDTPIIMLTANTDKTSIEQAFAAGASDYITKPFDVGDISTRVQIAARMVQSGDTVRAIDPSEPSRSSVPGRHRFAVTEPLQILSADQLILPYSLGNYLSQLSQRHLNHCRLFAAKIIGVEALYDSCTSQEFAIALSAVSDAISDVVNSPKLLSSYFGSGIFICIGTEDFGTLWPQIETDVQEVLDTSYAVFEDGRAMNINLHIGRPVRPNGSRTQRVKPTIDRAISLVERGGKSKRLKA